VILINLLPHREAARQRRKIAFFVLLGFSAACGLLVSVLWFVVIGQMTGAQVQRNTFLEERSAELDLQIRDVANLKEEIDALRARQKAVEDLQLDRNLPVHVLNELVRQSPDGVLLTSVRQDGARLLVTGQAQSNDRVTEFLRNTDRHSNWLSKPDLVEIRAANILIGRDQRRVYDFQIRLDVKRPQDNAAADAAGAAPKSN
jgi:type IV pilus assembly protein PilN